MCVLRVSLSRQRVTVPTCCPQYIMSPKRRWLHNASDVRQEFCDVSKYHLFSCKQIKLLKYHSGYLRRGKLH